MKHRYLPVAVMLLLVSLPLGGINIADHIRFNGFLSQGYIYTTENAFIPNSDQYGSFEISEMGLTFTGDISEKLTFGAQLLARDMGPMGNYNVQMDWGFADYQFADAFGLRFGRIKTPIGLYNETRDIDALRPMAMLPQSVYDELMRPVFVAYNGLGIYGLLDTKVMGSLDYHLFYGTVQHPDDAPYINQIQTVINRAIDDLALQLPKMQMETEIFLGGQIIWNTPLRGLRLGGTWVYHKARIQSEVVNTLPWTGIHPFLSREADGHMELTNCFFLSGEWTAGPLTLTAEYMELLPEISLELFGQRQVLGDENMQGYYAMLSYLVGDRWTVSILYDAFFGKKGDTRGDNAVLEGNPRIAGWQKDLAVGFRYDINFNWTIKAEWHFMDGLGKSIAYTEVTDPNPPQKWQMFVAKISFNF